MLWPVRIFLWFVMLAITAVLALIGLPIIAILAWAEAWQPGVSVYGKPIWEWQPAFAAAVAGAVFALIAVCTAWVLHLHIAFGIIAAGIVAPLGAIAAPLWGNREDGITGHARTTPPILPRFGPVFAWSAIKNKTSNLRYWRLANPQLDCNQVRWIGNNTDLYLPLPASATTTPQWSLAWQGLYAGFWYVWPSGRQFRCGWAIVPSDATKDLYDQKLNLRQQYCPWTCQLNRWSVT